jgi:hypothetical protein
MWEIGISNAWKKKQVCGATFPFQNMKEIDLSKKLNVEFGDDIKFGRKEVPCAAMNLGPIFKANGTLNIGITSVRNKVFFGARFYCALLTLPTIKSSTKKYFVAYGGYSNI